MCIRDRNGWVKILMFSLVSRKFLAMLNIALYSVWDHPFKTSACLRGGGVKNWPNLPTDSSKKLPTEGVGVKKS